MFLAKNTFHAGDFGYGLLYGAIGTGLVVGSFSSSATLARLGVARAYAASLGLMALGFGAAAVSPNVWVAAVCCVVGGVGNGVAVVCNALLVQRGTPDDMRGRALTLVMSATLALTGAGYGIARRSAPPDSAHAGSGAALPRRTSSPRSSASSLARERAAPAPSSQLPTSSRAVAGRRDWTRETLAAGVRDGDRRALARAITLVENGDPLAYDVVADLYPATGNAYAVGITGPPGVGKSSLISRSSATCARPGSTVGVVSVDPSSPFSQGALLGDRIRLTDHFLDPGVFIRSMGTRGHLGGLAEATLQALLVLDAAGKDLVFLETVGAGQSEVEVIGIADTVLLVLMPGSGDSVQALKAGIMEIPDVIAINKMDHPAAKTMLNEVRSILALDRRPRVAAADRAHRGDARRERARALGEDRGASRVPRRVRAARGAPAPQPRRRGVRGRVGAREAPSRAGGRRRSRAAAAARRGAAARARPAQRRAGDTGEGLPHHDGSDGRPPRHS